MKKTPLFFAALTALCFAQAQTGLTTKSIAVFKNGKSFVIKEGTVKVKDGVYQITNIPGALFGTFWFNTTTSAITQVTSKEEITSEPQERKANSFLELLHANKGKEITVTTDAKVYTGVVEDFDLPEEINSYLQLKETELNNEFSGAFKQSIYAATAPVLLLKVSGKWISIEPATIKTIEFAEKPSRTTTANIKVRKPVITVHFTQSGDQALNMMYLQDGISWSPVYQLELLNDSTANLKLQAEVTNGKEKIENIDVDFVVGVPNFSYATLPATLVSFIKEITTNVGYYASSLNFSNSQAVQFKNSAAEVNSDGVNDVTDLEAEASEDLYFYKIKNVLLEKDGRATFALFNAPVKVKHIYECVLPTNGAKTDESEETINDKNTVHVYHSIEVKNDTKNPLTSGPVLILQANTQKPIAQDLVKYTAKGASTSIKVTESPDVQVKQKDKVLTTTRRALVTKSASYSLVSVQSEVSITNLKAKEIALSITKIINGKMVSATIKFDKSATVNAGLNNNETVKFEMKVKAGGSQRFVYTYQYYIAEQ